MCTALKFNSGNCFFGRTLDNDFSYKEEVVIMPRRRRLCFREAGELAAYYALIGVAYVVDNYPLYYDACNEKGLAMAGLNYVGNAVYYESKCGKQNVATFEFIPYILSQCATVDEARKKLEHINITKIPFSDQLPAAQLHWMIADKNSAIVVECDSDGMHVYDNPVGVLTNNPPFPTQMFGLNNYINLSPKPPRNTFSDKIGLDRYSRGMGALGLPGDVSSSSRFVRAAFTVLNSPPCADCVAGVSQYFHIMGGVDQIRGCVVLDNGEYETTIYTTCYDLCAGVCYYTAYENHRICAVDMHRVDLEGSSLVRYPLIHTEQILMQN